MAGKTRRQRRRSEDEDLMMRLTARYTDEYQAGSNPKIEEYIQRYPQYTAELLDFAFYFHTVAAQMPLAEMALPPAVAPSPAAQRARAQVRADLGLVASTPATAPATQATSADAPALESLATRAFALRLSPPRLAQQVGISNDLLGRLDARTIQPQTIPPTLLQRFAGALQVTVEAIAAYFGAPAQASVHYYAEKAPEAQQQEPFLDAVDASNMSPDAKREWAEIAARELP